MNDNLFGVNAVVVGGTSGMGWAVAQALSAQGVAVTISGRSASDEKVVSLPGARGFACDLFNPARVDELAQLIADERPGIVVLNSGGPPPANAQVVTRDALTAALQQLFLAQVQLAQAALPGMKAAGWGRLVAIGSSGVQAPISNLTASNAARAALAAFLKTLAFEVAGDGITVNMVIPGRIDTDRVRQLDAARATNNGTTEADERAKSVATIPMGRYGRPEEFAAAVAFVCSRSASFITGSQLVVDGGMLRNL